MRRLLLTACLLCSACGATQPVAVRKQAAAETARDDRAMHLFVEGAEQLARDTPKSLARARELLAQAVQLDPSLWEAHYDLGLALRRQGALEPAREQLRLAHELAKSAVEPLWALAECELARGDLDESARLLEQLLGMPGATPMVEVRLALAALERRRGRLDQALTVARALLVQDAGETRALLEVGRIYRARGELEVAELVLEKARTLLAKDAQKSAPVYNELGLLALARGDTQLAFTHFDKAQALDPRFAPAHVNQGSVLLRAGDYEAAERAYRAALHAESKEKGQGSADTRVGLGIAQRGLGKYKEARATYEQVLEAHPSHLPALYDLAVLLADFLDQRKAALPLFERYLASAPKTDSHRESAERYLQDIRMSTEPTP